MRDDRAGIWTRYWASGQSHACPGSLDERLAGEFARFWREALGPLNGSDCVVELGAGNGAVSRLIVDTPGTDPPHIEAVDLADVRPQWVHALEPAQSRAIRFHSRTAIEQLPFADASVSHVVGQYAFEYAERDRAVAEVARCSRPGARLILVMHHARSEVLQVSGAERENLQWLLSPAGALASVEALLPDLERARDRSALPLLRQDPLAEQRRLEFNSLMAQLEARVRGSRASDALEQGARDLAQVMSTARKEGESHARRALALLRQSWSDSERRLAELSECALDESKLATLAEQLSAAGYTGVTTGTLQERDKLMAWTLTATYKPSRDPA